MTLYDVLLGLWAWRRLTPLVAALGLAVGLVASELLPPVYVAQGELLIGTEPRWASQGLAPQTVLPPQWHLHSEKDVVTSPALLTEALAHVLGNAQDADAASEVLNQQRDTLSVGTTSDSFVLLIRHKSGDPEFSARFVNQIMATYLAWSDLRLRIAVESHRQALVSYQQNLRRRIADAILDLSEIAAAPASSEVPPQLVSQLERRLRELERLREEIGNQSAQLAASRPITGSRVVVPAQVPDDAWAGRRLLSILTGLAASLVAMTLLLAGRPRSSSIAAANWREELRP